MVKVRGQMNQPIVDIAQVQEEYWERKTFELPSLAHLHKPTGWRKYLPWAKTQTPIVILRRMTTDEWVEFEERFYNLKADLVKDISGYRKIVDKMMEGKKLTKEEAATIAVANKRSLPMYIAMLEKMMVEPDLSYDQVKILLDSIDDYDRNTLMAQVNSITSQKMAVAHKINQERLAEMDRMHQETMTKYGR
jgi:predicted ribosome quality control (RQC) complex YloA/Tae2 family protein